MRYAKRITPGESLGPPARFWGALCQKPWPRGPLLRPLAPAGTWEHLVSPGRQSSPSVRDDRQEPHDAISQLAQHPWVHPTRACGPRCIQLAEAFPELILSHPGDIRLAPALGLLTAAPADRGRSDEGIQCLSLSHVLCHHVPCPVQQWGRTFPGLPFLTMSLQNLFLVSLMSLARFNLLGFGFPDLIPGCSDSVSGFLPGYPSFLPPSVHSLLGLNLANSSLSIHAALLALLPDFPLVWLDLS